MSPRVTAIVVVHSGHGRDGSDHLSGTLSALAAQTRPADRLVIVATGAPDSVLDTARGFAPTQLVTAPDTLPFGQAVALATRSLPDLDQDELLWFLAQDSTPRPDALRVLVGALETAPSVAIAAPKVLDGQDPSMIASFGQSVTRFGARVDLVSDEMDQGQHDHSSDVLGAQATAMLVRASVFRELGGFDPALVSFDGGLDLSIRARLVGHRVAVAPAAAVLDHGDGVAGPRRDTRASTRRRNTRLARFSQLHRRLVYSPAWALWLHWLALVPTALVRVVVALLRKRPETIAAEIGSALQAAFSRQRLGEARRRLGRAKTVPWSALAPLRISWSEVRRRRRLRAEDDVPVIASERSALRFFDGGGAWVVLASALLGVALVVPLLGGGYLAGANLTQLSGSIGELWRNAGFGWRDISVGQAGAADPFAVVLAVLGSITFWQPSAAVVAIMVAALPLATLGAWFAMVRLTERSAVRIVGAILWTVAPPFVVALADGRLHAVLVHLLVPWLFYAGTAAARSWTAAGAASIIAAVIAASAPSTIPVLLLGWLILLLVSRRGVGRLLWTIIPGLVLFAPLVWTQGVRRGAWLSIVADPGLPANNVTPSGWQLLLGVPSGDGLGWPQLVQGGALPDVIGSLVLPVAFLPLAVCALASLLQRRVAIAAPLLLVGGVGLLSAVVGSHLFLTIFGATTVPIWTGSALSFYWFALILCAGITLDGWRRGSAGVAAAAAVAAAVAVVPVVVTIPTHTAALTAADGRGLPAYVSAAATDDPDTRTLVLRPRGDDTLSAVLVRGEGETLDRQSTIVATSHIATEDEARLAEIAGNMVVASGADTAADLDEFGIRFVVVSQLAAQQGANPAAVAAQSTQIAAVLDANAALSAVGDTDRGVLWQASEAAVSQPVPTIAAPLRAAIFIVTAVVFLAALLLSAPTVSSRRQAELHPRSIGQVRSVESMTSEKRMRRRDRAARRRHRADRGRRATASSTRERRGRPTAAAPAAAPAAIGSTDEGSATGGVIGAARAESASSPSEDAAEERSRDDRPSEDDARDPAGSAEDAPVADATASTADPDIADAPTDAEGTAGVGTTAAAAADTDTHAPDEARVTAAPGSAEEPAALTDAPADGDTPRTGSAPEASANDDNETNGEER
ncbi:glycosyltransferase [Mycetocola reblochoni]|uniref:Glycosyl transferase, family 2 n=2 Tax=Mycetocola reblochoni TaxID=331618 RepID=A0A1R4K201_9MICO|nr:glycosyltransferase [Mycetocola reblochoni]RLP70452.1 hypothetical protein D9V30_02795 [Mycetocola reblochoni]SJN38053.1 Glycosyl transferase, family 2 [Mycetocola reblochoni REB411]